MAFAFVQSGSNSSGSTPVASLGVTLTGVGAGNLICIWVKHEGTPVGISVSDGTTTLTGGTKTDHGNGDLSGQFHYLLSANGGNKTYTVTFSGSVSRSFISLIAFEYSYSGTASLDGENGGSGNGTTLTSGNFTTTATDGVAFGGYGEYSSANLSTTAINGVAADGTIQLSGNTFSGAWRKTFSAGFTGAATAAIDNSFDWICRGIAFKAVAGGGGTVNDEVLEDTISVTDLAIPSQVRGRHFTDTIAALADSLDGMVVRGRLGSDNLTIVDNFDGMVVRGRLGSDDIVLNDEAVLFYRRNRMLDDSIEVTDEALATVVGNNILTKILSSTVDVTDGAIFSIIRGRLLQDTIIVSEPGTEQYITTNIVADDEIVVTDEYLARLIWRRVLGDDISITDEALASIIGQNIMTKVLTSTISTFDEALLWLNRVRIEGSVVLTADEVVRVMRFTRELTDAIETADSAQTALQRFVMLTDALTVDDGFTSLFITPTTVMPAIVIGFDQPYIKIGGYAVV